MKSKGQRIVFWSGLLGFVLLGLFPPWREVGRYTGGAVVSSHSLAYSFISSPPEMPPREMSLVSGFRSVEIDTTKLVIEWICLSVFTTGVTVGLGFGKTDKNAVDLKD